MRVRLQVLAVVVALSVGSFCLAAGDRVEVTPSLPELQSLLATAIDYAAQESFVGKNGGEENFVFVVERVRIVWRCERDKGMKGSEIARVTPKEYRIDVRAEKKSDRIVLFAFKDGKFRWRPGTNKCITVVLDGRGNIKL